MIYMPSSTKSYAISGRRTLMVDAAVAACGFLDSPNVSAIALIPVPNFHCIISLDLFFRVPYWAAPPCIHISVLFQATEDELQTFHSDDYIRALQTAHATLSSRPALGGKDVAELEEFGLFVSSPLPAAFVLLHVLMPHHVQRHRSLRGILASSVPRGSPASTPQNKRFSLPAPYSHAFTNAIPSHITADGVNALLFTSSSQAGGTLTAARALCSRRCRTAIWWGGGRHHAQAAKASG